MEQNFDQQTPALSQLFPAFGWGKGPSLQLLVKHFLMASILMLLKGVFHLPSN